LFKEGLPDAQKNGYMFYHLVKDDEDIAGMIAYCMYKKSKIEHIINFHKQYQRKPEDSELKSFQQAQCNTTIVDSHKSKAAGIFEKYQAIIYSDEIKKLNNIEKELNTERAKINRIKNLCPAGNELKFWKSVWSSALATLLLSLVFSILWFSKLLPSLVEILERITKTP
jgi:hypothetical protein